MDLAKLVKKDIERHEQQIQKLKEELGKLRKIQRQLAAPEAARNRSMGQRKRWAQYKKRDQDVANSGAE